MAGRLGRLDASRRPQAAPGASIPDNPPVPPMCKYVRAAQTIFGGEGRINGLGYGGLAA